MTPPLLSQTEATITSLPSSGTLHQLTHIFNTHGYDPKAGTQITTVPSQVTGTGSRLVYKRPAIDREQNGEWDRFEYTVSDRDSESRAGTVTLVGPSRSIVASDFRFSSENWTTLGNRKNGVSYEPTSRGIMNHYVYAADDILNIDAKRDDIDLWYFHLPSKFNGWHGIVYGGTLNFSLSSFSGDFSPDQINFGGKMNLVEIHCAKCDYNRGVTVAFPLEKVSGGFSGSTTTFSLDMKETSGWLKDPENVLLEWTVPSKCELIEVLSGIESIKILGDFTRWYETVSIDNVQFLSSKPAKRYHLPPCAQGTPDARKCTCR
mmetsp:Transcript_52040/g.156164  ORF Transcript_52040/g.156164 Transcript_52040/m.156164 type:complete len:319 (+) Transcript_52040:1708-2664(+)